MEWFLKFRYPILVLIISFFSVSAMLHSGFPPSHDGEYHIVRFYEFDKTLRNGNWFPRWAPDLNQGFGIPLFNFVYPFPNYAASFFHFFGISFIDTFKLSMFFASLIGALFFYLWTKRYWGELGGVVSAIFYTFSPYHFVDIYIRGSIGEVWAIAFFPLFLWSIDSIFKNKSKLFIILSGASMALIILSHNILGLMFFYFSLTYVGLLLFLAKNKKAFLFDSMLVFLIGLSLSAIFWLPALMEKQYTEGLQIFDIKESFPEIYQFIFPSWGSGFADADLRTQMSFQIGIANLSAVFISLIVLLRSIKKKLNNVAVLIFFLAWFFIIFCLMNRFSLPVWKKVPFMDYFQFPWRFLSLEILVASFLAGSIFKLRQSKIIAIMMVVFTILISINYAKPAYYHNRQDSYYMTRSNFIDGTNSPANIFNTIWMNRDLKKQKQLINLKRSDGEIKLLQKNSTNYHLIIDLERESELTVNTAFFPGWSVQDNRINISVKPSNNGLISFTLTKGIHDIQIKFKDTLIRKIASIWSLLTIIILIAFLINSYYVKIKK